MITIFLFFFLPWLLEFWAGLRSCCLGRISSNRARYPTAPVANFGREKANESGGSTRAVARSPHSLATGLLPFSLRWLLPPSRERFASSGPHGTTARKDSATLGRISLTTALGTRARLRAHTGRRMARTPPTDTSRAAGKEIAHSLPTALEGLSPSALQHRPLSAHQPFTLASRGFARGTTICSDSSAEAKASRPTHSPPRSRPTE